MILNVNPDVFTLLCSREYSENESCRSNMNEESGNIDEEIRYKMCFITFNGDISLSVYIISEFFDFFPGALTH